jgi:predicted nucleotidyltransferase
MPLWHHSPIKAANDNIPGAYYHERYGVSFLGVFGSYVRSGQHHESDLDILVEFDHVITLFQFVRLENELSAILGMKVDLVMKSARKSHIGPHLLQEVVPV